MFTKGDLINGAYAHLRISGLTVQPSPEDVMVALDRLEDMAAEWYETRNVRVNYRFEEEPAPESQSGITRPYKQAFETNLALWLADSFGKTPGALLVSRAAATYSAMSGTVFPLREVPYPSRQPVGSGNVRGGRYLRYYPGGSLPDTDSTATKDAAATEGYEVSWTWWLTAGGALTSSTWDIEEGDNQMVIEVEKFDDERTQISVSGGTKGMVYKLTNQVESNLGRSDPYSIYIRIT